MVLKNLIFRKRTPLYSETASDRRKDTHSTTNTLQNRSHQSTSNGHYSSHGYRGRGNRYNGNYDGELSASARLLRECAHNVLPQSSRYGSVSAYTATAHQTSNDRQEISEPATIIWCEGGMGEVMSPTVWRNPNLHLYFDATKTTMEGQRGWSGLRTELEPGMELDITFTLSARMQQLLQDVQHGMRAAVAAEAQQHVFICIGKIEELRVSKCPSSVRSHEQAVVIARRESGTAFLINNSGERTVLHPNFLPLNAVRHAILEKAHGPKAIAIDEANSPSSLCMLGRSLAVRLAPAPSWLPTIYPTDRGVTRWALSAEPYGEEKWGRAVVVQSTRHSITLCAVEGDLAGRRTTLHAPIIQMTGQIKMDAQERGSVWRFRACRELPGRSAVWRAFELDYELDSDSPLSETVVAAALDGNLLIDVEEEEQLIDPFEEETRAVQAPSVSDDLAQLVAVFAQPLSQAATAATPPTLSPSVPDSAHFSSDDVLVFASIDGMIESETFADDVFRAPSILPNEWLLLGVPPAEAVRTEQEMLLRADLPRSVPAPRIFGVHATGDERPDMRVHPKRKKKRRTRQLSDESLPPTTDEEEEGEEEREERSAAQQPDGAPPRDLQHPREEEEEEGASDADDDARRERKRAAKEEARLKKHLASIAVSFATGGDDIFSLLHGGDAAVAAAETSEQQPMKEQIPPHEAADAVPQQAATADSDLFELLRGVAAMNGGKAAAAAAVTPQPSATFATINSDLLELMQGSDAPVAAAVASTVSAATMTTSGSDLFELLSGCAAPVVSAADSTVVAAAAADPSRVALATTGEGNSLFYLLPGDTPAPVAATTAPASSPSRAATEGSTAASTSDEVPSSSSHHPLLVAYDLPDRPRAPRFAILPYPDQPKYEDGWWFRPSRPRPPPVERKKSEEKEEVRRREAEDSDASEADGGDAPPEEAYERPKDDLRERLLDAVKRKKKEKEKVEQKKEMQLNLQQLQQLQPASLMENVLVDLTPVTYHSSPSPSPPPTSAAAPSSAPLLPSPSAVELYDDLKDIF